MISLLGPSPLPFESIRKQYTEHFVHTSTGLASKLERSKATYDSSHQICVILDALVKIFEDLSNKNTTKLQSLSAETQSQLDFFSNGLPGAQFDYYAKNGSLISRIGSGTSPRRRARANESRKR
jgi:hypothetical protein